MRLVLRIVELFQPKVNTNSVVHKGQVISVAPIDIRKGQTVITPDGLAEIQTIIPDWITKKPIAVDVYLYRGFMKRFKVLSIQQYVVYHYPTGQFVKLSPGNYRYIYKDHQSVEYRITNRCYAQMTDLSKTEYEYIKTLNKQRGGSRFLQILNNQNVEIKKK